MFEVIEETIVDSVKILPFLFITYLIMEYIEHKMKQKSKTAIKKSGKYGPLIGGIVGIFPQCGFSVSATNLYAGRVITLGTLISVYLATSDEMLPIFISEGVSPIIIIKVLAVKLLIGIVAGFIIDFVIKLIHKNKKEKTEEEKEIEIEHLCEEGHCHCEDGSIIKSALSHTINIFAFIIIVTFIINILVYFIGEENISNLLLDRKILGPVIAGLVGLIPNCAASVILTNMYLENVISAASMISGLLTGAGVGLAVLFKTNKNLKENLKIVGILYLIGAISGIILELLGFKI